MRSPDRVPRDFSSPDRGTPTVVYSIVLQVCYILLFLFYVVLLTRFVLGQVLMMSRRWHPARGSAAALEVVWSVTDPPLKALRRVIPPLRIGTVSIDLTSIVLLVILLVLMYLVRVLIPG